MTIFLIFHYYLTCLLKGYQIFQMKWHGCAFKEFWKTFLSPSPHKTASYTRKWRAHGPSLASPSLASPSLASEEVGQG